MFRYITVFDGVSDLAVIFTKTPYFIGFRHILWRKLDPYPRKPGATFEEPAPAAPEASPFAVLSKRGAGADGE